MKYLANPWRMLLIGVFVIFLSFYPPFNVNNKSTENTILVFRIVGGLQILYTFRIFFIKRKHKE